jgi:diguanylate cyclase (GGDEF)-like protein
MRGVPSKQPEIPVRLRDATGRLARETEPATLDLSACDNEPIHIPGTVQSYGVLFALERTSTVIKAVSDNVAALLGHAVKDVLERPIGAVIAALHGPAAVAAAELSESGRSTYRVTIDEAGPTRHFEAAVHFSAGFKIIEIEPVHAPPGSSQLNRSGSVMLDGHRAFSHMCVAGGVQELCDLMVAELKSVTGYDRAMVYRFDEDGAGEVVAEARSAELEPYLGLHYPASDIPAQARSLYLTQSIRYIADAYAPQAALVPQMMAETGLRLDLSSAFLRSPSPIHLEYMRNMGVASSVVMSLVKDGTLWGMLVAHNTVPLACPSSTRAACDFVGMLGSSLLAGATEIELVRTRGAALNAQEKLSARLSRSNDLTRTLADGDVTLGHLVAADGFAIGEETGGIRTNGFTPPVESIRSIARDVKLSGVGAVFVSDSMVRSRPAFGALDLGPSCGILFAPVLEGGDSYVAWFRNEKIRSIKWAGDPNKPAVSDPSGRLRPRNSFALWSEEVRGRSERWSDADLAAAAAIREHLASAQLRLALAQLAKVATHDPLTGLVNRRAVDAELDRLAAEEEPRAALIFIDLDRFKTVNDSLGHGAGDEFLIAVASRLKSLARPDDVVARIGGDEFVLLSRNCSPASAARLARRVVKAFETPFAVGGSTIAGSASVGWATAKSTEGAAELVRRADTAMYYAKRHGGNRASRSRATRRS